MLAQTLIALFTAFSTLLAPKSPAQTDGLSYNGTHLNHTTIAARVITAAGHSVAVNSGRLVLR